MKTNSIDLRNFKLMNGDSILAVVLHETHDNFTIEKPVLITSQGDGLVRFTYWLPYTDEKIHVLSQKQVVISSPVTEVFKEQYLELYDEMEEESPYDPEDAIEEALAEMEAGDTSIKIH